MSFFDDSSRNRRFVSRVITDEIAREIELKKNPPKIYVYDEKTFNDGINWYISGMSLEEASLELREDKNFIRGYELAARQDKIHKSLEIQGAEWYYSGKTLEESNYADNEYFIKGYNDAKNSKKRRWFWIWVLKLID